MRYTASYNNFLSQTAENHAIYLKNNKKVSHY